MTEVETVIQLANQRIYDLKLEENQLSIELIDMPSGWEKRTDKQNDMFNRLCDVRIRLDRLYKIPRILESEFIKHKDEVFFLGNKIDTKIDNNQES